MNDVGQRSWWFERVLENIEVMDTRGLWYLSRHWLWEPNRNYAYEVSQLMLEVLDEDVFDKTAWLKEMANIDAGW